jgi:hypothetical protein
VIFLHCIRHILFFKYECDVKSIIISIILKFINNANIRLRFRDIIKPRRRASRQQVSAPNAVNFVTINILRGINFKTGRRARHVGEKKRLKTAGLTESGKGENQQLHNTGGTNPTSS